MPHLLKPAHPRACALQQEKPHQGEATATKSPSTGTREEPLLGAIREKPVKQQPSIVGKKKINLLKIKKKKRGGNIIEEVLFGLFFNYFYLCGFMVACEV